MSIKLKKSELESLIKEAIREEFKEKNLNEQELEELFGGLKNVFGTGAQGTANLAKKGAQAVGSTAQRVGSAVAGTAQKAGQAVAGAAQKAGGAIKATYQAGERDAALNAARKELMKALDNGADKATLKPVLFGIQQALSISQGKTKPPVGAVPPPPPPQAFRTVQPRLRVRGAEALTTPQAQPTTTVPAAALPQNTGSPTEQEGPELTYGKTQRIRKPV